MPVPILPNRRTTGRYNAEKTAARIEALRMRPVSEENSFRFSFSRTSVLVVTAPAIPSLKLALISLLRRRTDRWAPRICRWKYHDATARGGTTSSTSSASPGLRMNIATAIAAIIASPQTISTSPHATVSPRR